MRTYTKLAAIGCLAILAFCGCQKTNSSEDASIPEGKARMNIFMMDDPALFTAFYVDIRQVAVKLDTAQRNPDMDSDDQWDDDFCGRLRDKRNSSVIWDTLDIRPGVYDLLQLRNGVDTLLASGVIPQGKILKVRITLGTQNSIVVDSTKTFPLFLPSPLNVIEINIRREHVAIISSNHFSLWIDFDLQKSILFRNNTWSLFPILKAFNDNATARLLGTVLPRGASPLVKAFSATDTLYALPGREGNYLIRGVPPGTYSLTFTGQHGYKDTTITGITVEKWFTQKVPTITLHK